MFKHYIVQIAKWQIIYIYIYIASANLISSFRVNPSQYWRRGRMAVIISSTIQVDRKGTQTYKG